MGMGLRLRRRTNRLKRSRKPKVPWVQSHVLCLSSGCPRSPCHPKAICVVLVSLSLSKGIRLVLPSITTAPPASDSTVRTNPALDPTTAKRYTFRSASPPAPLAFRRNPWHRPPLAASGRRNQDHANQSHAHALLTPAGQHAHRQQQRKPHHPRSLHGIAGACTSAVTTRSPPSPSPPGVPPSAAVAGFTVHFACAGAPEHVNATLPGKPAAAFSNNTNVAGVPLATVIEVGTIRSQRKVHTRTRQSHGLRRIACIVIKCN